jgi:hypothetical protein
MDAKQAAATGKEIAELVTLGETAAAWEALRPVVEAKTPFRLLDKIGAELDAAPPAEVDGLLMLVSNSRLMGGWVVIAAALGARLKHDMPGALSLCREQVMFADAWYAADSLGERVPGPALLLDFPQALSLLDSWRFDPNPWVRRVPGVAVHFWAKRTRGKPGFEPQAADLLGYLAPQLEERRIDAAKGIGWGLKTLARYYPNLAADWLADQLTIQKRKPRAVVLRKALTYLPASLRAHATGETL